MRILITLLSVALIACPAAGDGRIVWNATLGAKDVNHKPAAITRLADGTLVAAGIVEPSSGHQTAAIWFLDETGRVLRQLPVFGGGDGVTVQDIRSAGETILLLVTTSDGAVFAGIDREGSEFFRRDVGSAGERPEVIVPLESGGFLLTGRAEGDALVIAVDEKGNPQWKKRYDQGRSEAFAGGFETAEGVVLAGESRDGRKPLIGSAWIAVIDARTGELKRERRWPGRDLRIAPLADGAVAAVLDRAFEFKQDVAVLKLDRELQPVWTTPISREHTYRGAFRIAASNGTVHVAGTGDITARVWRLESTRGKVVWSWEEEADEKRPWHVSADGLVLAADGAYVLTTMSGRRGDGMPASQIGVLRFSNSIAP